ncbi:MAG: hypothetical protein ACWGN2_06460, partial [Anaerolineales bacterium]
MGIFGSSLVSVTVEGIIPLAVAVEFGVGVKGIITAISGAPPVSGGLLIPSKSLMISKPIAG